ncbi:MAG: sensor histidine kinase KdpD [Deltaproteobacteria bacterium]|nr:sensor histidine kinase KdpD [Deltaproteobacteria bacterium]
MVNLKNDDITPSETKGFPKEKSSAGKLKIFFGAAPGAGKTFAMLKAAKERLEEGVNVVLGNVNSHGQPAVENYLSDFKVFLLRAAFQKERLIEEFDLDSVLALPPDLILLDDLAHINAPGSRHKKRWQDIDELLRAGIDVYTTLDVLHLESQKDLIFQISGKRVYDSVPDTLLERADEIQLVDIPPDDLLKRLEQRKINVSDWTEEEIEKFFRPGVLLALRELALRQAAEKLDDQMRRYRSQQEITTVWPATERLLVCVGPNPRSDRLIRATRRMAAGLRAPWLAVHVEAPALVRPSSQDLLRLEEHMRLAESLGAETVTLHGNRADEAILDFARARNVNRIIIGKPTHPRWKDRIFGSLLDAIVRGSEDIEVYVITGDVPQKEKPPTGARYLLTRPFKEWLFSILSVVGCFALASIVAPYLVSADLVMIFLLGIVLVAGKYGRGPSLLATLLSIGLFDFFFVPPFHTFAVHDPAYIVTFGVMFVVAHVISRLTYRVKDQADAALQRERRTAALYSLSRDLVHERSLPDVARIAKKHISEALSYRTKILFPGPSRHLIPLDPCSDETQLDDVEQRAADWAFQNCKSAGSGTDTHSQAKGLFLPLLAASGPVGVIGLWKDGLFARLSSEQMRLLNSLADQTAQALERVQLAEEAQKALLLAEREQLRNTLLSSVSHDLRTPLAVITGAGTTLLRNESLLDEENRRDLVQTIVEEADHLNRLIRNIMDMMRLEAGGISVTREWQSLEEIVGGVINRMTGQFEDHNLEIDLPSDLPLIPCDGLLIAQVLRNLLENAVKHTPPQTPLVLSGSKGEKEVVISIADQGKGIPAEDVERIFEKFVRGKNTRGGAGLGLAICKGIVAAHGGRIWAENQAEGGAVFSFTLPVEPLTHPIELESEGKNHDQ